MNIGDIIWPKDARAASAHYLTFMIQVVDKLGIVFPSTRPDPRVVARRYLGGQIADEAYIAARDPWWDALDGPQLGNFRDPEVLLARLALCLLYAMPEEAPRLGEHLSWFFEVLGFMGKDLREAKEMMERYFAHTP
jgi:hypothetical protein